MDLKEIESKVTEIVKKAEGDKEFMASLKADPVKAVEGLIGKDLPDTQIHAVVDAVKAKVGVDKGLGDAKDILGSVEDTVKNLFHKE